MANFVAECFCPDVDEAALRELDARAGASAAELAGAGEPVRYLGSILMREDEVVLWLFAGGEHAVRRVVEQAENSIRPDRRRHRLPWPVPTTA